MAKEESRLEALKSKMSNKQREDMAELIQNELKRRKGSGLDSVSHLKKEKTSVGNSAISGGLSSDDVSTLYRDTSQKVKELRLKKLEQQLGAIKSQKGSATKVAGRNPREFAMPAIPGGFAVWLLVIFGGAKIVLSTGLVDAAVPPEVIATPAEIQQQMANEQRDAFGSQRFSLESRAEKRLLTELDARRVELEQRSSVLEQREKELEDRAAALSERLAEVRSLTTKLEALREERSQRADAKLEQLASVYGSMAPDQAAPLIEKLDEDTALDLLQRMSGKRMGQILSLMDADRAIALTRKLTQSAH